MYKTRAVGDYNVGRARVRTRTHCDFAGRTAGVSRLVQGVESLGFDQRTSWGLVALLREGGAPSDDVVAESGSQALNAPEDFWTVALGVDLQLVIVRGRPLRDLGHDLHRLAGRQQAVHAGGADADALLAAAHPHTMEVRAVEQLRKDPGYVLANDPRSIVRDGNPEARGLAGRRHGAVCWNDFKLDGHVRENAGFLARGHIRMEFSDGCTLEFKAPQVVVIEPGHDGWVVGDEPAVLIEFDFENDTVHGLGMPERHSH